MGIDSQTQSDLEKKNQANVVHLLGWGVHGSFVSRRARMIHDQFHRLLETQISRLCGALATMPSRTSQETFAHGTMTYALFHHLP